MARDGGIAGLVLAGGRSRRFGADKGHAVLAGKPLADHARELLAGQCDDVAISGEAGIADPEGVAAGPLAGVLSGLRWAHRAGWLATLPVDTPLVPADFVARLIAAAERANAPIAHAATSDGAHPLCAVWRPSLATPLEAALEHGHPPIHRFAADMGGVAVSFPEASAFLNINTPDDLARAESVLAGR